MSLLSVYFAGIELCNPVIVASSPATEDIEGILKCAEAGAIITKSIADYHQVDAGNDARRTYFDTRGFLATSTFHRETLSYDDGIRLVAKAVKRTKIPIIASITATSLSPDNWLSLCRNIESAGASAIQLDLFYLPQPISEEGNWKKLLALLDIIGKSVSIPVLPKLNIEMPAYLVARDFQSKSIKGISLLDSIRVPSPVNIDRAGLPKYGFVQNIGMSSLFGSWQYPITQHYTMILGRLTDYPLCVGGGVMDARNVVEMVMLGASTVQFATAILLKGYDFIHELLTDLSLLVKNLGCSNIHDIKGIALKNQVTDLEGASPTFSIAKASIDNSKCIRCGQCLTHSFCRAIVEENSFTNIKTALCDGCGFCVPFCEHNAITIKSYK